MTVQGLQVRGPAQVGVWLEAKARVEAEWADHLPQGRAEVVSVQTAEQRLLMLPDSLAIHKAVRNAV